MTVPSLAELRSYVEELIESRKPEGKFYVFEWEFLVQQSRRNFKTTSPAISSRLKEMLAEGALDRVEISHHGYTYLDSRSPCEYGTLYFQYTGYREDYGYITADRIQDMQNVWKNGRRYLYTTGSQLRRMQMHFLKIKEEHDAKEKAKEADEKARLWEILEKASPGAKQVLDDLYELLSSGDVRSQVKAHLWDRRGVAEAWVEIAARNTEQSVRLIDVIRRGLAGKDEES